MLVQLDARDFRNIESLSWRLDGGTHLILGENGAGKTSLLEAIYLLATTRSFRTSQLADCQRHGQPAFELGGEVESDLRARLELSFADKKVQRRVNGHRGSLAEHLSVLPVICWTSEQGEVIGGGPGHRRRFLDRGVLGLRPAALEIMSRYRQTLSEKRRLLMDRGRGLEVWNQLLAETAAEWVRLRAEYVERLAVVVSGLFDECGLDLPRVELRYRCSPRAAIDGVDALLRELEAVAPRERAQRRALIGPHRDELEIRWTDQSVRRTASAGERKALGLLLLAAQGRILASHQKQPLYLLDDIDTELDERRLSTLWKVFRTEGQIIATSNRSAVWTRIELDRFWQCRNGQIEAGPPP